MRHTAAGRSTMVPIGSVSVLSLAVVGWLRLPYMGAGGAQHSRNASETDILLELQEAVPPGSNPLRRGKVYRQTPKVIIFRRMPTGPEAFWGMPGVSGLRPYARTHLKKRSCAALIRLVKRTSNTSGRITSFARYQDSTNHSRRLKIALFRA